MANQQVARETWWLELDCADIAAASLPGQFVMVGFGSQNTGAPYIPRPFSVSWRSSEGRLGLLVREFGAGTRRLAGLHPGERVLLLGPLGRGFVCSPTSPSVCVAGGVGLAPFLFLVAEAGKAGHPVRLLYGEREAERVFEPSLIETLCGQAAEVWTEDGGVGRRGRVVDGIDWTAEFSLLGCGPPPMLTALAGLARRHAVRLQVSVEEHMGCGVGTCQGCVVPGADGTWRKACTEGPVFEAAELEWPA